MRATMLAVSAAAAFLRCTEAAHLICTCKALNNDPGLRDRTAAGSREAERDQNIRDDAAAAATANTFAAAEMELWSRVVFRAYSSSAGNGTDEFDIDEDGHCHERDDGITFGDFEEYYDGMSGMSASTFGSRT